MNSLVLYLTCCFSFIDIDYPKSKPKEDLNLSEKSWWFLGSSRLITQTRSNLPYFGPSKGRILWFDLEVLLETRPLLHDRLLSHRKRDNHLNTMRWQDIITIDDRDIILPGIIWWTFSTLVSTLINTFQGDHNPRICSQIWMFLHERAQKGSVIIVNEVDYITQDSKLKLLASCFAEFPVSIDSKLFHYFLRKSILW